ncbi:hypothetical protein [Methylobacterium sp. ID0610]|uniref:hypothetical protein n=1 Tax=Methylobacterium carpenticola TaxID=3344827 RepID=UPI0036B75611
MEKIRLQASADGTFTLFRGEQPLVRGLNPEQARRLASSLDAELRLPLDLSRTSRR